MRIEKTSEKVLVWMHRQELTQIELAKKLGTTRQTLARKISENTFSVGEIMVLKSLGFSD